MKNKSKFRKSYIKRLIFRIIIFIIMISIYIIYPNTFEVSKGINFIKMFSPLHIIWLIWMIDMILQLCKVPKYWPLGSQKYWAHRYLPNIKEIDKKIIKKHIQKMNKDSVAIAITWILVICLISGLYFSKLISYQVVILISTAFYVCDIICVIGWCPFKTFYMHNKCCTTCRIFNWDHAMMFTPLIVIPGIWTYSLVIMSLIVLTVWEIACAIHPERFLEKTNCALQCHNCKDKLCGK
ncbi:MAG: hypothetical protein IK137_00905 [Bacilli bacterium]|nr:hypothetical protein [Bacilli bacterium]